VLTCRQISDVSLWNRRIAGGRVDAVELGSTKARLYIDCVRPSDAGSYTCVAETSTRRITTTTMLYVGQFAVTVYRLVDVQSEVRRNYRDVVFYCSRPIQSAIWLQQMSNFVCLSVCPQHSGILCPNSYTKRRLNHL